VAGEEGSARGAASAGPAKLLLSSACDVPRHLGERFDDLEGE